MERNAPGTISRSGSTRYVEGSGLLRRRFRESPRRSSENYFSTNSVTPSARTCCSTSAVPAPVKMMTGCLGSRLRTSCKTVSPSIPGMFRSRTMTSGVLGERAPGPSEHSQRGQRYIPSDGVVCRGDPGCPAHHQSPESWSCYLPELYGAATISQGGALETWGSYLTRYYVGLGWSNLPGSLLW